VLVLQTHAPHSSLSPQSALYILVPLAVGVGVLPPSPPRVQRARPPPLSTLRVLTHHPEALPPRSQGVRPFARAPSRHGLLRLRRRQGRRGVRAQGPGPPSPGRSPHFRPSFSRATLLTDRPHFSSLSRQQKELAAPAQRRAGLTRRTKPCSVRAVASPARALSSTGSVRPGPPCCSGRRV
jgi:hypothetical protein